MDRVGRRRWHFAGATPAGDWSTISDNPAVTLLGVPDAQRWPGRTTEQRRLLSVSRRYGAVKVVARMRHRGGQSTIRGEEISQSTARFLRSVEVNGGIACGGRMGTSILPANARLDISRARKLSASNSTAIKVQRRRPADMVMSRQSGLAVVRRSLSLALRVSQLTHQSDTQAALAVETPLDPAARYC
jgi:hypothetical protein